MENSPGMQHRQEIQRLFQCNFISTEKPTKPFCWLFNKTFLPPTSFPPPPRKKKKKNSSTVLVFFFVSFLQKEKNTKTDTLVMTY